MLPDAAGTGGTISIPDELRTAAIASYMTGTILKIEKYLPSSDTITLGLTEVERNWYYLEITSLRNIGTPEAPVYVPYAPWSNQILGGQQLIADDQPPVPTVELFRVATQTGEDEGLHTNGFINTTYDLRISWEDNVGVGKNWIIQSGEVLQTLSGHTLTVSDLFFDDTQTITYTIGAQDFE